jgi:hypothetical protein
MKLLLRIVFVALIALGIAGQALRAGRGDDDTDTRGALVDRLARQGIETTALPDSELLMARSPLCQTPFLAGLLRSDGADGEMIRPFSRPDVVVEYIYLGAVEEHPSQVRRIARWGWEMLLFHAGLRRTRPAGTMAMVAFPQSCVGLRAVDWAALAPRD